MENKQFFIKQIDLQNKKVFLRADLNVPIKNGLIIQDHKLKAILPTIDFLLRRNAKIVLATHLGRPDLAGKNFKFVPSLSTQILLPWFKEKGYEIEFEKGLEKASLNNIDSPILLLENLRFFKGERKPSGEFANKLKKLANIYINDAFGLIHRNDTSITLLPQLFDPSKRSLGLLIEKEIKELQKLKEKVNQPFLLVCGGNKVKDKIPLLESFINKTTQLKPKTVIIGGAMAYTFLQAKGICIGKSPIEKESVTLAQNILNLAKKNGITIMLPMDHLVVKKIGSKAEICNTPHIPNNTIGVDIGPKSLRLFSNKIKLAKTIFANGTMGIYTNPNYEKGSKAIMKAIAKSTAYSIIGGGDAVSATIKFGAKDKINFLSTGGGATLKFLSTNLGEEYKVLPGLIRIT